MLRLYQRFSFIDVTSMSLNTTYGLCYYKNLKNSYDPTKKRTVCCECSSGNKKPFLRIVHLLSVKILTTLNNTAVI